MSHDPYPEFTRDDMQWFYEQVCQLVGDETLITNTGRRKAGLDLELLIVSDERRIDETLAKLNEAACLQLTGEVSKRTGILKPVIYVDGHPHPSAQESLDYAAHQL